jgi:hypothetical protein
MMDGLRRGLTSFKLPVPEPEVEEQRQDPPLQLGKRVLKESQSRKLDSYQVQTEKVEFTRSNIYTEDYTEAHIASALKVREPFEKSLQQAKLTHAL